MVNQHKLVAIVFTDIVGFTNALEYFNRFNKLNPNNLYILTYLGNCNYALGNLEIAEIYAKKVLEMFPSYGWAQILLSKIKFQHGNYKDALELIKSAENYMKNIIFNSYICDLNYLEIYNKINDQENIEKIFNNIKSNTDKRDYNIIMAQASYIIGDYSNARFYFEKMIEEKHVHLWIYPLINNFWNSEISRIIKSKLKF